MATTPLERLLFLQGGLCFFCGEPLPKADASVEHLQALASGGTNHDDNCVACCKAVNRVLGSRPLKAKIQVVLNQKGAFRCPNQAKAVPSPKNALPRTAAVKKADALSLVIGNLKQRGASRPRTLKALTSTITALLGQHNSMETTASLIEKLRAAGKLSVSEGKVTYAL